MFVVLNGRRREGDTLCLWGRDPCWLLGWVFKVPSLVEQVHDIKPFLDVKLRKGHLKL